MLAFAVHVVVFYLWFQKHSSKCAFASLFDSDPARNMQKPLAHRCHKQRLGGSSNRRDPATFQHPIISNRKFSTRRLGSSAVEAAYGVRITSRKWNSIRPL